MRTIATRFLVSALVLASLAAQSPWQNVEFRPSPSDKPALQVLVGDFTRRSTGDVLLHEATVRNQATSVFDLFAQDGDGRMLRVQSPTTGVGSSSCSPRPPGTHPRHPPARAHPRPGGRKSPFRTRSRQLRALRTHPSPATTRPRSRHRYSAAPSST